MSETRLIDIKELRFDEHNFNRHNDEGMQLLEKSIKKNGSVRFSEISKDIEELHQYPWERAYGYNCNSSEKRAHFAGMTMAQYMRWLWNNPQAGQSPYTMFEGVMKPDGKDENGDIIYIYDKERTI